MEILTYVLEGALEHRDSLGNGSVLQAGQFQRMSAGTGIRHSEFNPSDTELVHLYQIWLIPERDGIEPSYEERSVPDRNPNQLRLIASRDARLQSLRIHQDADVYIGLLDAGAEVRHALAAGRYAWMQVLRGQVAVDSQTLSAGDGLAASAEPRLHLKALEPTEILLFDLA